MQLKDKQRFLLGNVLPDAYANGSDRHKTHYIVKTDTLVYFDFSKFRYQYLYSDRVIRPSNSEEVAMLHNDYHILNSHIVNQYQIQNMLTCPVDLKNEAISDIAEFRVNEFLKDMSGDFMDQTTGATRFLTEDLWMHLSRNTYP